MRGVTQFYDHLIYRHYISTHTPHARRDRVAKFAIVDNHISTHTPHARRDLEFDPMRNFDKTISTHTPHARRDCLTVAPRNYMQISTHTPHARRDVILWISVSCMCNFNSHASCEAWPFKAHTVNGKTFISTHTPHARRDRWNLHHIISG